MSTVCESELASVVVVDRNGHHLSLAHEDERVFRRLVGRRIVSQRSENNGVRPAMVYDSLLSPRDGMRRANAGLLEAVRHVARCVGRRLQVRSVEPIHQLPLNGAPRDQDRPIKDRRIPEFLTRQERGVIRLGREELTEVVADAVARFPAARIAILGAHQPQLAEIYEQLSQWFDDRRVENQIPLEDDEAWIATSTFTNAASGPLERAHLVLLVDAVHATHANAEAALAAMDAKFRLFGILNARRRLSPSEKDVLMATFGPRILDVPRLGREFPETRVAWVDINGPPVNSTHGVQLHRRGYWRHPARNRKIVQLAQALRGGSMGNLSRFPHVAEWVGGGLDRPLRVTILVHNTEHALAFARRLPGWPMLVQSAPYPYDVDVHGLNVQDRRFLEERRPGWDFGDQQIICLDVAKHQHLESSDVVIWAGGGPAAPAIPRCHYPMGSGDRRLLIVDFTDRHNDTLAQWSRQRMREYSAKDCFRVGQSDESGRMERFIQTRPSSS